MITTILLTIVNWLIKQFITFATSDQIWPQSLIDGIYYIAHSFANFNFIIPIDTLFNCILFLILFMTGVAGYLITAKVFNYFRGSGGL